MRRLTRQRTGGGDVHAHGGGAPGGAAHGHAHDDGHGHGHAHDDGHGHAHDDGHTHRSGVVGVLLALVSPHDHSAHTSDRVLESTSDGIRAVFVSLAALAATAVIELVVALASHSVALLADTIHNFADALTAVPLALAFRMGRRAPTRRYTYGFGRAEDVAGVAIVALIAASAVVAAYEAVTAPDAPPPRGGGGVGGGGGRGRVRRERARRPLPHPCGSSHRLRRARRRRDARPVRRLHLAGRGGGGAVERGGRPGR